MDVDAVLVSFTWEGHQTTYETSGILFNTDIVLLTGTALIPLVQQEKWIALFLDSSSSKLEPNSYVQNVCFRVHSEPQRSDNWGSSTALSSYEGRAVGVWKCPFVSLSAKKLFSDWTLGHLRDEKNSWKLSRADIDLSKELMSVFIFVKCEGRGDSKQIREVDKSDEVMRALLNLLSSLRNASRGQEVEVVSTPFGHKHFINSLSRGVISNAVGCEKCIILSDARTVSGCEGGPIFLSRGWSKEQKRGQLVGIVTCPLTWWRGEWVGLTIGISLLPVISNLLHSEKNIIPSVDITDSLSSDSSFRFIDESVVLVRSKHSWGSGVILDVASGIVLTCSHVVQEDESVSVFHMNYQWSADVIFGSQKDVAYDLAIIKIKHNCGHMKEVNFAEKPAKLGEKVIAAGFPFFSEQDDVHIRPSIVSGCVSWVNPYMIQTTCCIQSGFSGGPLFRNGELLGFKAFYNNHRKLFRSFNGYTFNALGIIVSNTIGSGALYPHINFVAPSWVFKDPILKFIRTNNILCLRRLESSNVQVQHLWKLHTSKL